MSPSAFVCSRCDEVYRGTPSLAFLWDRIPQGADLPVADDVDLCPNCRDEFCEAMQDLWGEA